MTRGETRNIHQIEDIQLTKYNSSIGSDERCKMREQVTQTSFIC